MASYWKSNPRYFCEICKCWLADNKASIEFHERGKSHIDKKEKHLSGLRKRSAEQFKNQQQAGVYLRQMEDAALKAYQKDLAEQGLVIDSEMPHLGASRPSKGIHELHFQEGAKKKVKIHNKEDFRESKIIKNSPWVKQVSPEGREYYWNSESGESRWDKPPDFVSKKKKSEPQKPVESKKATWMKQVSPEGKTYYYNTENGKTSWDKPDGAVIVEGSPSKSLETTAKSTWTEEVSPEGHTYYWNSETGKSQWEKPDDYKSKPVFTPVVKKENDSSDELPAKKPRHNPYGTWNVVQNIEVKKQVDWQLPAKSEDSEKEGLVDRTTLEQPVDEKPRKFNEKIVTSLDGEGGSTTFKKKSVKSRSIRKRIIEE